MTSQRIYQIHKLLAVSVGGFFLAWLISGIVMVLPRLSGGPKAQITDSIDIKKVSPSATAVLAGLETVAGDMSQVKAVTLKRLADSHVYEIVTARRDPILIDAESGGLFRITAQTAAALARRHMSSVPHDLKVDLLSHHELSYPWGPLPVYRVIAEDNPSIVYYVSARDGAVQRSNRESRIRNAIASLHTLEPIKLLIGREAIRKGLLILTSLIGIAAVSTGFYLAFKRFA
jgi:hypothetical protein